MPILNQAPIPYPLMQQRLQAWLAQYGSVHIVAEGPDDIQHFCEALITGPGFRLNTQPLTMEIRRNLDAKSQLPHKALAHAKANRLAHLELEKRNACAAQKRSGYECD